jgi:hypothetical protein
VSQLKAEIEVCVISKFHIPVEFEIWNCMFW